METWKDIPGFPGYQASDQGNVRSLLRKRGNLNEWYVSDRPKVLAQWHDAVGRRYVSLSRKGQATKHSVPQLILRAFVGERPPGMQCCHNNGDFHDNALSNLRWDTPKSNHADMRAHGTMPMGESHASSKLKEAQVLEIRARVASGERQTWIAREFGVSKGCIEGIVLRHKWKHL